MRSYEKGTWTGAKTSIVVERLKGRWKIIMWRCNSIRTTSEINPLNHPCQTYYHRGLLTVFGIELKIDYLCFKAQEDVLHIIELSRTRKHQ